MVLVPFVMTPKYSRTPMVQDGLDSLLAAKIERASKGAGVIV